jgi:hypothetical protein
MPERIPEFDETKGLGLAAVSICVSIVSQLAEKRLLSPQEIDATLEKALSSLEDFGELNDPGVRAARVIVEGIAAAALHRRLGGPTTPQ